MSAMNFNLWCWLLDLLSKQKLHWKREITSTLWFTSFPLHTALFYRWTINIQWTTSWSFFSPRTCIWRFISHEWTFKALWCCWLTQMIWRSCSAYSRYILWTILTHQFKYGADTSTCTSPVWPLSIISQGEREKERERRHSLLIDLLSHQQSSSYSIKAQAVTCNNISDKSVSGRQLQVESTL